MNPTSQSPEQKFPFGADSNAINNKPWVNTLIAATILAFAIILMVFVVRSGNKNPLPRVPFGLLVTVLPGLGAYVVLRLTNIYTSRRGAIFIYFALVVLAMIIQGFVQVIPVAS